MAKQKQKEYKVLKPRLQYQFLILVIVFLLVPVFIAFFIQIVKASRENKESSLQITSKTAEQISGTLDSMHTIIYNTSEVYANDETLLQAVRQDYAGNMALKRVNMVNMKNQFLGTEVYSPLLGIGAIYTGEGELFNLYTGTGYEDRKTYSFYDPVSKEDLEWIMGFEMDSPEKFAILHWYGLQPNRFQSQKTGSPRTDLVVLGSRRTFQRHLGYYLNTHIFIIPEEAIYNQYKNYLREEGQQVYILDKDKNILSSTDEDYLTEKKLPEDLLEKIEKDKMDSFIYKQQEELLVSYAHSQATGWYTVVVTPSASVTSAFWNLFRNTVIAVLVLLVLLWVAFRIFSNYFSRPLGAMVKSMHKLEQGGFEQVPENNARNEIGQMTRYYNQMINQLENLIEEKYEKERHSKELEGKVLVGQINPHFMYNTLETIVWKAHQAKRPDIAEIASGLGQLLRLSVNTESVTIPWNREFEQSNLYVSIQKMRYKERLKYTVLPHEPALEKAMVLRLVLQPCIENAIVHGMRKGKAVLHVQVQIEAVDQTLVVRVYDNGNGMTPRHLKQVLRYVHGKDEEKSFTPAGTGIGIRNIHERIVLYFGSQYGVDIESAPDAGTVMIIKMPLVFCEDEQQPPVFPEI